MEEKNVKVLFSQINFVDISRYDKPQCEEMEFRGTET